MVVLDENKAAAYGQGTGIVGHDPSVDSEAEAPIRGLAVGVDGLPKIGVVKQIDSAEAGLHALKIRDDAEHLHRVGDGRAGHADPVERELIEGCHVGEDVLLRESRIDGRAAGLRAFHDDDAAGLDQRGDVLLILENNQVVAIHALPGFRDQNVDVLTRGDACESAARHELAVMDSDCVVADVFSPQPLPDRENEAAGAENGRIETAVILGRDMGLAPIARDEVVA